MQKNNLLIAPSTERAKDLKQLLQLEKDVRNCADVLHCDIMDGVFVERQLLDQSQLKALSESAKLPLDFHLMCDFSVQPEKLDFFIGLKPWNITVHLEAFKNKSQLVHALQKIKNANIRCGLAVKIETPINKVFEFLENIDNLLVMSVKVGWGGQQFDSNALEKVKQARNQINKLNKKPTLQIDGGVTNLNSKQLVDCGADFIVSGSYVFNSQDRCSAVASLRELK